MYLLRVYIEVMFGLIGVTGLVSYFYLLLLDSLDDWGFLCLNRMMIGLFVLVFSDSLGML